MNFSKLNTNILRQVLKLSERKETLLKELEKIEAEILSSLHGHTTIRSSTIKKSRIIKKVGIAKKNSRGTLKESILQALTEAGSAGLKIPELSEKINTTSASIHVWFSNVGKKMAEIEKIGPGHFRIRH